jgi:hypothetical protein
MRGEEKILIGDEYELSPEIREGIQSRDRNQLKKIIDSE